MSLDFGKLEYLKRTCNLHTEHKETNRKHQEIMRKDKEFALEMWNFNKVCPSDGILIPEPILHLRFLSFIVKHIKQQDIQKGLFCLGFFYRL